MDIERVIAQVVPVFADMVRRELAALSGAHTWYEDEAQTQTIMREVGHLVAQALAEQEGSGLEGPSRVCPQCGSEQAYHDQRHPLTMQTSVGAITWAKRASYRCRQC